ncbi:hypothetical protein LLH03_00550 [bacterium]|nr:hypothetical protein [bacterium]
MSPSYRTLLVLWLLVAACGLASAQASLLSDAVVCQALTPRGEAVSPGTWFPGGTKSLILRFRTLEVPRGTPAEVRWLLHGSTLSVKQLTLGPNRVAYDRFMLGMAEPFPIGTYDVIVSVNGRADSRVRFRIGGQAPETTEAPVGATVTPTTGAKTPGVGAPMDTTVTGAVAGTTPAGSGAAATDVKPPSLLPPPTASASVAPAVPVGASPAPTSPVISPVTAAAPTTPAAAQSEAGRALTGSSAALPAPVSPATPVAAAPVTGSSATAPSPATTSTATLQTAEVKPQSPGSGLEQTAPVAPVGTPLGPRAGLPTTTPLVGGSEATYQPAPTSTELLRVSPEVPVSPVQAVVARTGEDLVASPVKGGPHTLTRTAGQLPEAAHTTAGAGEPSAAASATEGALAAPPATPLGPRSNQAAPGAGQAPLAAPLSAPPTTGTTAASAQPGVPVAPEVPTAATAETPGTLTEPRQPTTPAAPTPGATPAPETAPAATTPLKPETAPTPAPAPTPAAKPLVLRGPLLADGIAEDLLPVVLNKDAVKLYLVNLVPVPGPAGIQPLWSIKMADGRFWPPGVQTPAGFYAGDNPDPNPGTQLLYSDHMDGITPLYEVPRHEAALHAARENEASLLVVSREVYDVRRKAWQDSVGGWSWVWFARQVDLTAGDTLVACLVDVKRSDRAPEDFTSTARETVMLLDEQGKAVRPRDIDAEITSQLAGGLGAAARGLDPKDAVAFCEGISAKGVRGLRAWAVTKPGRYQVWSLLPLDKSRATCKIWTTAAK